MKLLPCILTTILSTYTTILLSQNITYYNNNHIAQFVEIINIYVYDTSLKCAV